LPKSLLRTWHSKPSAYRTRRSGSMHLVISRKGCGGAILDLAAGFVLPPEKHKK